MRGRWLVAQYVLRPMVINPWAGTYDVNEDAAGAITSAMAALGDPTLTLETQAVLADFARSCVPADTPKWNKGPYRAQRQNALRMLIATCPDAHVC
jgi:hypothetical protein